MTRGSPLLYALAGCLLVTAVCHGGPIEEIRDLPYKSGESLSELEKGRCKLDLYLPKGRRNFPTLVWLYGGALTGGERSGESTVKIARRLAGAGIAVAVPDYRLSPGVQFPAYVEDAAAAFAWVRSEIATRGGDPDDVFLGGHSAGAYLSSLVAMDPRYLEKHGLTPDAIAGLVPLTGQMMTHFTVRKERGIGENTIIADEAAPIYFTREKTPPFLILFGDRDWPARLEENQYFAAAQKAAGNDRVTVLVIPDRDHGSIADRIANPGDPAAKAIIDFIGRVAKESPRK